MSDYRSIAYILAGGLIVSFIAWGVRTFYLWSELRGAKKATMAMMDGIEPYFETLSMDGFHPYKHPRIKLKAPPRLVERWLSAMKARDIFHLTTRVQETATLTVYYVRNFENPEFRRLIERQHEEPTGAP